MVRFVRLLILVVVFFLLSIPTFMFFIFSPKNVRILYYASKIYSTVGFWILGIKVETRNLTYFEEARPSIIISNHQSFLDVLVGAYSIPKYTVSLGKKSIVLIPFFGLLYWISGNILINRKNKKDAYKTMENVGEEIKKRNIFVWIMAEGTRNKTSTMLLPLKKGPFYVATSSKIPICPVCVSRFDNINLNRLRSGKMIIEALPPIPTQNTSKEDIPKLMNVAYEIMEKKIREISQRK